jgi:Ca2+-transporting ATPase
VEIIVLSVAILAGYPLPLLPVQILYVNLATDGLPAIALGVSPSDPDIMERLPRNPKETVFTREVKTFFLIAVLVQCPLLFGIFLTSLPNGVEIARTRLFLILVFFQLVLALNCRSLKHTLSKVTPHRSLWLAVLVNAALTLVLFNIPEARQAFGVVPIGLYEFVLIAGLSLITLFSVEITKLFVRSKEKVNETLQK